MSRRYNFENIRALLTKGFSDEELRRLCFDMLDFEPVYDELAQSSGKTEIVRRLLEFARRQEMMDTLLAEAEKLNPARFKKHLPYYGDEVVTGGTAAPKSVHKESRQLSRLVEEISWMPKIAILTNVVFYLVLGSVILKVAMDSQSHEPGGIIVSMTPPKTPTPTVTGTPCPFEVFILIKPFEKEGGGNLNVERSILEAFERPRRGVVEKGIGQIDVQIGERLPNTLDAYHVFMVEGWYDSAAVHTQMYHKSYDGQLLPLDCCIPGEPNLVPPEVVIEVCYQVADMWREEGCNEAALELLFQLKIRAELDQTWNQALFKFLHKG